ncbi:hypothetical protein G6F35_015780 [Rhizopus arrhizus]|nr:hypothetical protein G6F35_015780 [Rhizopus arrhizus]
MLGFGRGAAVLQELGELLAGGRPDGGTREELDRRIACREGYHKDVLVYDRCGKPLWVAAAPRAAGDGERGLGRRGHEHGVPRSRAPGARSGRHRVARG